MKLLNGNIFFMLKRFPKKKTESEWVREIERMRSRETKGGNLK